MDSKVQMRKIYTCQEWGARTVSQTFARTAPTNQVVHHMDWPNRPLIGDPKMAVEHAFVVARQCQVDHMDNNGWADTGQHFTITREGIILEGRHGSLDALLDGYCIHGAHAYDPDTGADDNNSWGVEHEGTYSTDYMPSLQWEAAIWLQAFISLKSHLDTVKIIGHRDTGCNTACPGDCFEGQLPLLRLAAHQLKVQMIEHGV